MDKRQKILIVDDAEFNRVILKEILGETYNYLEAENGNQAIQIVEENPEIDLMLLDINMPQMNGFGVLEWMNRFQWIAEYCRKEDIRCVVVGDIRNIRKEKDMGHKTNQKFHGLPYNRLYIMLEYKLKLYGIQLIKQEESYTSQCSPLSPEVSKRYAEASNRKERGMYVTDGVRYNADAVGAFNILRKYLSVSGKQKELSVTGLKNPEIIKVAA